MKTSFQRYAIYWKPEPGSALAVFGENWFANAFSNSRTTQPSALGLSPDLAFRATRAPAHYGIHATLKGPFRARDGVTENEMQNALDAFCKVRRAAVGGPLKLARFQDYLGLVLAHSPADIDWLAEQCVILFDGFRAPLQDADRKQREIHAMNSTEAAFFEAFGYPYILSEFQFHISLAGPLGGQDLIDVEETLRPNVAMFELNPMKIGSLCLLGEPQDGAPFELISRHSFLD